MYLILFLRYLFDFIYFVFFLYGFIYYVCEVRQILFSPETGPSGKAPSRDFVSQRPLTTWGNNQHQELETGQENAILTEFWYIGWHTTLPASAGTRHLPQALTRSRHLLAQNNISTGPGCLRRPLHLLGPANLQHQSTFLPSEISGETFY